MGEKLGFSGRVYSKIWERSSEGRRVIGEGGGVGVDECGGAGVEVGVGVVEGEDDDPREISIPSVLQLNSSRNCSRRKVKTGSD